MAIGEGIGAATLFLSILGMAFTLGKAWHRLRSHSDAIRDIKKGCTGWTQRCATKQDETNKEIRQDLATVKTSVANIETKIEGVQTDIKWLVRQNGGPHDGGT